MLAQLQDSPLNYVLVAIGFLFVVTVIVVFCRLVKEEDGKDDEPDGEPYRSRS